MGAVGADMFLGLVGSSSSARSKKQPMRMPKANAHVESSSKARSAGD